MTLLEKARQVYAAILSQRNGMAKEPFLTGQGYEKNEINEESPPSASWLAPGLTSEDVRTPYDDRDPGEEG